MLEVEEERGEERERLDSKQKGETADYCALLDLNGKPIDELLRHSHTMHMDKHRKLTSGGPEH